MEMDPLASDVAAAPGSRNGITWWAAVDSNHVPPRYQHGALPVELAAQALTSRPGAPIRNLESNRVA